ncbi:MAG: prolyl oligopeptidase family serine peptidase [Bryobacteraceae bacterium]
MLRAACALVLFLFTLYGQKQPFDVQAMLKIARISEPRISPDGKLLAFTVQTVDLDQNTKPKQIYVMPLDGGIPLPVTPQGTQNERPRWSPDSLRIAFISNRGGSAQVWIMNADGSQPKQITSVSTEAGGVLFSPDGKKLVFTSNVFPDCPDDNCNRDRIEAEKQNKVKARTYTTLLFRHWTTWQSKRRSHLLVVSAEGGPAKDLTPGANDVPPFSLGGADDYAISPDSSQLCYVMNSDPVLATSTNTDLYTVALAGGEAKRITNNPGADDAPQYSPDGKGIAYRSQERGGYESDRWRLLTLDFANQKTTSVTETLDRSVAGFTWSPDSTRLFFTIEDRGRHVLYMSPAQGGASRLIASGPTTIDDVQLTADGKTMIYTEQSGSQPVEIYRTNSSGSEPVALTHLNDSLLADYSLGKLEEMWVNAPDKTKVHSFVLKPAGFERGHKYPVLFLIHGGPQGAWGQSWSYRWNPQIFASAGYVVVMPNPRGSTGYGQKFTDDINQDWGGKPFDDIMAVVDHIAALPYTDAERMAAAGGSYGGYMVDWMLGHTQRFKALVSHAGVFDLRSMAGATEELWFPLWEFHGMPWENPEQYAKWSPSYYVTDFHTPTLVIHGELDFRVPYTQGLQLYTSLQMQKVPSKLLVYPDEGHWILKPLNTVLWYDTFLDWIGEWLRKPAVAIPAATSAPVK